MEVCSQSIRIHRKLDEIPTLESTKVRLFTALEDEDADLKDIERIIEKDPAMAAKVIKLANAAFYRREAQVESIHDAILTVGFDMVKCITVSMAVMHTFGTSTTVANSLWRHSVAVGVLAFGLGKDKPEKETLLSGGLLHDLGRMVLLYIEPDVYAPLFDDNYPDIDLEQEIFSMDHAAIGEIIAKRWHFPPEVVNIIRNHHRPNNRISALIRLVDCVVSEHDNKLLENPDIREDIDRIKHFLGSEYKSVVNDVLSKYNQGSALIEDFI